MEGVLNAFTADIDFDVADSAANLADQVDGTNGHVGSLDDAANIEVISGAAVDGLMQRYSRYFRLQWCW